VSPPNPPPNPKGFGGTNHSKPDSAMRPKRYSKPDGARESLAAVIVYRSPFLSSTNLTPATTPSSIDQVMKPFRGEPHPPSFFCREPQIPGAVFRRCVRCVMRQTMAPRVHPKA